MNECAFEYEYLIIHRCECIERAGILGVNIDINGNMVLYKD